MDPKYDVSKFVGAASAPVALIIAACIYLGNLTAKYNALFRIIRTLSDEMRHEQNGSERQNSIRDQLQKYELRILGAMRAVFWMNLAILCFVLTVFLTGLAIVIPGNVIVVAATTVAMCAGLLLLGTAVITELWSNRLAKPTLKSELRGGTPEYQPIKLGRHA